MQEILFENKYFERGLTKKTFKKLTWFFSFALSLFLWTTLKKQKKLGTSYQSLFELQNMTRMTYHLGNFVDLI